MYVFALIVMRLSLEKKALLRGMPFDFCHKRMEKTREGMAKPKVTLASGPANDLTFLVLNESKGAENTFF